VARKVSSRVVVNRAALTQLQGAFADGMAAIGELVIGITRPPDATPFGEGLVTTGDWGVWTGGRKTHGTATKPRAAKLARGGITLVAGWGFPARFQEMGTVHQPARPFYTPRIIEVLPDAASFIRGPVRRVAR
jgi:hypothetical protein